MAENQRCADTLERERDMYVLLHLHNNITSSLMVVAVYHQKSGQIKS